MRRILIAGNWKMNGSLASNAALLSELKTHLLRASCDVAVCTPSPYFEQCRQQLTDTPISWGAQDLSPHEFGAYTGEVSAQMAREFGCRYAIVGHSERRAYHGESNMQVAQKALRALSADLTPIVCVGETLDEREAGQTDEVVAEQLQAVLDAVAQNELEKVVVAYEPVWAIGTGKTATPDMAQEVHANVRAQTAAHNTQAAQKIRILYGGSMKPDNAAQLLAMPDIDGGLIGGASLKAADFLGIIEAAQLAHASSNQLDVS